MRARYAIGVTVWLAWAAWVAIHALAIPGELLIVLDHPLDEFPYWRTAALDNARALAGAALVALAAWGAGAPVVRRLTPDASSAERLLAALAIGFGLIGLLSFTLAAVHVYTPPVVAGLLAAGAAAGVLDVVRQRTRARPVRWGALRAPDTLVFGAIAALATAAALVGALAPETEYDALWYHLWLPARWLAAGRAVDIVEEYVSLYPLGWDLAGGAAMVVGGPVAAKLLHWACLPLTGLTTWLLAVRLAPGCRPAVAAALAVVTPITIWEATTAYVDLALTWYVALGVYALVRYDDAQDRRWLLVSAIVMGGALAVKHLALVALAVVVVGLTVREWRCQPGLPRAGRTAVVYACVALALASPWYVRAYRASGNPVFPDLYAVFGATPAERWSPATERALQAFKDRFGRPRTPHHLLLLPWDTTVHAARYGGTLGPLFLILVPAALVGPGVRRRTVAVAAGCLAYGLVWASPVSSFQMRFVIPLVPFLAVLGAEGALRLEGAARQVSRHAAPLVLGVVAALLLLNLPPTSGWHEPDRVGWDGWMTHIVRRMPFAVVLGAESRESYLARTVPSYAAWQVISQLPQDVRILTFSGGDHLYATRARVRADATVARPATWEAAAGDEGTVHAHLAALSVSHVLFDKRQVEDGTIQALAIGTGRMRACCLAPLWEDARFALYEVRRDGAPEDEPLPRTPGEDAVGGR